MGAAVGILLALVVRVVEEVVLVEANGVLIISVLLVVVAESVVDNSVLAVAIDDVTFELGIEFDVVVVVETSVLTKIETMYIT